MGEALIYSFQQTSMCYHHDHSRFTDGKTGAQEVNSPKVHSVGEARI